MTRPTTAAALAAARAELGLSLQQLADALGLVGNGADALRKMESGRRAITGPIAVAVELLLKLERLRRPETAERLARAMAAADSGPQGSGLFEIHWGEFQGGYRESAETALAELIERLGE